uniref:Uncharacterized protein MANES_15G105700 n=3 Tax=Rhizophora mucronata TaxID=61149 RepID=A0A2P2M8W4_RHIMU
MSVNVDQTSVVDPHNIKMSTAASSGASTTAPKVSMFAAKTGFVIPKNKLSGSLVPIFREGKKPEGNGATSEETKQVQRKTKWGPDLTQDAAVRKGRALGYQTRVNQITQQLKYGILETGANQDSLEVDEHGDDLKSVNPQIDSMDAELLELERREVIGEILKLNPSYKPPPDYKPLLKEARVPIPVKEYPGYNFVGLIFGPQSEGRRRLEKETGAQIQVYGTKAHTGEKVEISPSDGSETQVAYEELSVHVSADTFEKVDAAVALLELLVTSVSGNLLAGDNATISSQSQETSTPFMFPAAVNQGGAPPVVGPSQGPQQGQFQYQGLRAPKATPHAELHPHSVFITPQNASGPILSNPVLVNAHSSPFNPSTLPSLFGPRPVPASGSDSILQSPSLVPPRPLMSVQLLPNPYPSRNFPISGPQSSAAQINISAPPPLNVSQPQPTGSLPAARPLISALPHPLPATAPGLLPERPLAPFGSSSLWSGTGVPSSLVQGNIGQTPARMVPFPGTQPMVPQQGFLSSVPSNMPSGQSALQLSNVPLNRPAASSFNALTPIQVGPSMDQVFIQPSQSAMAVAPTVANPSPIAGSTPTSSPMTSSSQQALHSGIGSFTGNRSNFTLIRPHNSGPGEFTFQPHHPQNSASHTLPRPSSHPATQSSSLSRQMMQPLAPQVPSFHLHASNPNPQPGMHLFPRLQVGNQMGQTQAHTSPVPFAGTSVPPRPPAFSNLGPVGLSNEVLQMGARNFSLAPQLSSLAGPFPPRPGNPLQLQQNFPAPTLLVNLMAPNQQPNRPASSLGGQQIYDPFSPTSISIAPQQQGGGLAKGGKQENDPEYEDLMASVGVK